jgi:hypothetical protein
MAEQFSWYLCFGMIIHQIPRDFTKNIKERLFYNVPENFDVYFTMFLKILLQLMTFSAYEKQKSHNQRRPIGNVKFSHQLKIRPLKTTFFTFPNHEIILICVFAPLLLKYEVSNQIVHSNGNKNCCCCNSTQTG